MSISQLLRRRWSKTAFEAAPGQVPPPPMDPAAGGMPPMDPAAGGMPPMDPAAGGMPPLDPAMMGGIMPPQAPGGMPPLDPSMLAPPEADSGSNETMIPLSEVIELLGAVTGKRAPKAEDKPEAAPAEAAPPPAPAGDPLAQPMAPMGGMPPGAI